MAEANRYPLPEIKKFIPYQVDPDLVPLQPVYLVDSTLFDEDIINFLKGKPNVYLFTKASTYSTDDVLSRIALEIPDFMKARAEFIRKKITYSLLQKFEIMNAYENNESTQIHIHGVITPTDERIMLDQNARNNPRTKLIPRYPGSYYSNYLQKYEYNKIRSSEMPPLFIEMEDKYKMLEIPEPTETDSINNERVDVYKDGMFQILKDQVLVKNIIEEIICVDDTTHQLVAIGLKALLDDTKYGKAYENFFTLRLVKIDTTNKSSDIDQLVEQAGGIDTPEKLRDHIIHLITSDMIGDDLVPPTENTKVRTLLRYFNKKYNKELLKHSRLDELFKPIYDLCDVAIKPIAPQRPIRPKPIAPPRPKRNPPANTGNNNKYVAPVKGKAPWICNNCGTSNPSDKTICKNCEKPKFKDPHQKNSIHTYHTNEFIRINNQAERELKEKLGYSPNNTSNITYPGNSFAEKMQEIRDRESKELQDIRALKESSRPAAANVNNTKYVAPVKGKAPWICNNCGTSNPSDKTICMKCEISKFRDPNKISYEMNEPPFMVDMRISEQAERELKEELGYAPNNTSTVKYPDGKLRQKRQEIRAREAKELEDIRALKESSRPAAAKVNNTPYVAPVKGKAPWICNNCGTSNPSDKTICKNCEKSKFYKTNYRGTKNPTMITYFIIRDQAESELRELGDSPNNTSSDWREKMRIKVNEIKAREFKELEDIHKFKSSGLAGGSKKNKSNRTKKVKKSKKSKKSKLHRK